MNEATLKEWHDISVEKHRTYHFPNGERYVVLNPRKLKVTQKPGGDSHRIISDGGVGHYIRAGWLAVTWTVHEGAEVFVL